MTNAIIDLRMYKITDCWNPGNAWIGEEGFEGDGFWTEWLDDTIKTTADIYESTMDWYETEAYEPMNESEDDPWAPESVRLTLYAHVRDHEEIEDGTYEIKADNSPIEEATIIIA